MRYCWTSRGPWVGLSLVLALLARAPTIVRAQNALKPLRTVATVPDLGSLVRTIGGKHVTVTVLAKGTEDPHFVEAKPSFIKALSQADLYVQLDLDLEIGWAPTLLQQARNRRIVPGAPGYLDASSVITPLDVP